MQRFLLASVGLLAAAGCRQETTPIEVNPIGTSEDFFCCARPCCLRDDGQGRYCTGNPDPSNVCYQCTATNGGDNAGVFNDGATCDTAGDCFGPGTCSSGACTGGVALTGGACSDNDNCTINDTCTSGTCAGTPRCAGMDNECATYACSNGTCVPTFINGPCTSDGLTCTDDVCGAGQCRHDIQSGFCVIDGACVAADAMNGPCQICDPARSTTAWSPVAAGEPCGDARSCSNGVLTVADACDGAGNCTDNGTTTCGAYRNCASATDCATTCSTLADCVIGAVCTGNQCIANFSNGESCTDGNQCQSGHCVDTVCCDDTCAGVCRSCRGGQTGGQDGTCANITAGTDPSGDCTETPASSCGLNGFCDAGACAFHSANTVCAAAACDGAGSAVSARQCNGSGTCLPGTSTSCAPGECANGACVTSCVNDGDCNQGYCDSTGTCSNANRAPVVRLMGPGQIPSGEVFHLESDGTMDPDGDSITYTWSQTDGPRGTLGQNGRATFTVTAPVVEVDTPIAFELSVSDGELHTEQMVDVDVLAAKSGCSCDGSGGGLLLIGAAALLWRRKRTTV